MIDLHRNKLIYKVNSSSTMFIKFFFDKLILSQFSDESQTSTHKTFRRSVKQMRIDWKTNFDLSKKAGKWGNATRTATRSTCPSCPESFPGPWWLSTRIWIAHRPLHPAVQNGFTSVELKTSMRWNWWDKNMLCHRVS